MALRIDLHTHSTVSDGTDTPSELVRAAADAGLDVVAITDHDTTGGWDEAVEARPPGLALVRGAEFSCVSPTGRESDTGERPCSVHLLGYLFDPRHPAVVAEQERLRDERATRLEKMIDRMAADGYPVDLPTVLGHLPDDTGGGRPAEPGEHSGLQPAGRGKSVGRPHLARALVAAGVVGSVNEAFADLLHPTGPYYVRRSDTPVETAIAMIVAAGGVAVFAHPLARRRGRVVEPSVIEHLAGLGLGGVEVDHPDHAPEDRELLRDLAARHGLLGTGSSDYHGTNKTTPIAAETTGPDVLDALLDRASGAELVAG